MTFTYEAELALMSELVCSAGRLQSDSLGGEHSIRHKGPIDLVTEVDCACERLIVDGIAARFPQDDILAEEGTGVRRESSRRWIVDPLDGTVNFAHAFPFFCAAIALEVDGVLEASAIFDPNRNELFTACRGYGVSCNGNLVQVSKAARLDDALLATGFAYNVRGCNRDNLDHFSNFLRKARALRRPGSACIDLAWVACGRIDGFWELFLKPWDMAAGVLMVREAGGQVTSFDGSPYDLYGVEICVSNGFLHNQMIEVLMEHPTKGMVDNG